MKYYGMAREIIYQVGMDIESDLILVLLALWNNMGHIHSHFFNTSETCECIRQIQELIECDACVDLDEGDLAFFQTVLFLNPNGLVSVAAPAA